MDFFDQQFDSNEQKETDDTQGKKVFIVEDDIELSAMIDRILKTIDPSVRIDWATSAEEAITRLNGTALTNGNPPYDLIIADIFLEGPKTGLDFWRRCSEDFPDIPLVITSGLSLDKYFKVVGHDTISPPFLSKPFTVGECRNLLETMFDYGKSHTHYEAH